MPTKDDIKWLFTLAGKNDINKQTLYAYIAEAHKKDSVRDLTDDEMDDALQYVSDARQVSSEKMIYLIIKTADTIKMSRNTLNKLAHKFGAHTLEELDSTGLRGIMSILASMTKKIGGANDNSPNNDQ